MEPVTDLAAGYPNGLTQREVEVLRLVAQCKSNREIGEELVISEGTARRHVSNIYDKIGVTNHAEATRYALEETPGGDKITQPNNRLQATPNSLRSSLAPAIGRA